MHAILTQYSRQALDRGASDLHLVVGLPPSLRLHGEIEFLAEDPLSADELEAMLLDLLDEGQAGRLTQDRDLQFSFSSPEIGRFRANLYYSRGCLEASFRLVPQVLPALEELGLPEVVRRFALFPSGLVLITGSTGQGKTTTLNAMIDVINSEKRARIVAIEDPIEYLHVNKRSIIIQREVDSDTNSFQGALRAALRQDPNVIRLGELRSLETVATALTAAETGHLVMATLHTNSAPHTIDRIVDIFPAHQQNQVRSQLANTLRGVVCLQLLPRVAEVGRVLACEVMVANQAIRNLIRQGRLDQMINTISTSSDEGMVSMDRSVRQLYEQGQITYDTALEWAHSPDVFKRLRALHPGA